MGHLTRVANAVVQNAEQGPNAEQLGQLLKGEAGGWLELQLAEVGVGSWGCPSSYSSLSMCYLRAARGTAAAMGSVCVRTPG